MEEVCIGKVLGSDEESLKTFLGSGNDSSVISEEKTSDYSDKDNRKEIALAAFVICVSHSRLIKTEL